MNIVSGEMINDLTNIEIGKDKQILNLAKKIGFSEEITKKIKYRGLAQQSDVQRFVVFLNARIELEDMPTEKIFLHEFGEYPPIMRLGNLNGYEFTNLSAKRKKILVKTVEKFMKKMMRIGISLKIFE